FLIVRRFGSMLLTATLVCATAMISGTYAAFFLDSAPAPTIILILTALFIFAFAFRQIVDRRATTAR
ncbi:MAG: metal ABC transporter permease, partial [Pseudomonadota bacterium]